MHSYFPKTRRKKKYASEHTTSDLFAFKHLIGGFDWKQVLLDYVEPTALRPHQDPPLYADPLTHWPFPL